MIQLAAALSYLDLHFLGVPGVIATVVVQGDGIGLIDPGPTSTLPSLERQLASAGASVADVTALLLTHIHLDHAGASGTLVKRNPNIKVFVHENGAPHMANPEKLIASATRLYGDDMDRLWGEFLPVPPGSMTVLKGGETVSPAGHRFDVAYTPGHASHHVSYLDPGSGVAFVGDTAGVKVGGFVLPPTPPPDIDLELWRASLARIEQWRPAAVFMTHFGPASPVAEHLAAMRDHLELVAALAKASLDREGTDADREHWFVEQVRCVLRKSMPEDEVRTYEAAGRFDLSWRGLARYWRKKAPRP